MTLAERLADFLIQQKTSGMCNYGKVCTLCDCGIEGLSTEEVIKVDSEVLDLAIKILEFLRKEGTNAQLKC